MSKKKIFLTMLLLIVGAAIAVWYYAFVYSKYNHRRVEDEKGIVISAVAIVKEYQENEQVANVKYLDKAIEVSGEVLETGKNQENKTTITLKSADLMSTVLCTLKDSTATATPGQQIVIKGICIGFLSDVKLKDAIIIK